jgi:hypothetical protein
VIVPAILPLFCNPILRRDVGLHSSLLLIPGLPEMGLAMPASEGGSAEG